MQSPVRGTLVAELMDWYESQKKSRWKIGSFYVRWFRAYFDGAQHERRRDSEGSRSRFYTRRKLVCETLLSQVRYGFPLSRE